MKEESAGPAHYACTVQHGSPQPTVAISVSISKTEWTSLATVVRHSWATHGSLIAAIEHLGCRTFSSLRIALSCSNLLPRRSKYCSRKTWHSNSSCPISWSFTQWKIVSVFQFLIPFLLREREKQLLHIIDLTWEWKEMDVNSLVQQIWTRHCKPVDQRHNTSS